MFNKITGSIKPMNFNNKCNECYLKMCSTKVLDYLYCIWYKKNVPVKTNLQQY